MTVGIVTPLPDGVLFVAEGRRTDLSGPEESVLGDDVPKIIQIAPDVAVITFGISGVTGHFMQTLRDNYDIPNVSVGRTPEQIVGGIDQLLARVWQHCTFPPGTDLTRPDMTAGFGVGGLASGLPFVGMTVRSVGERLAYQVSTDQRARVVLGGVNCDPHQIYLDNERRELEAHNLVAGNTEPTVRAYIRAAASAIREIERFDPAVGGTIRYSFFYGAPNINPMVSGTYPEMP